MENKLLKNRVAVITGASKVIGKDIVLLCAKEGVSLVLLIASRIPNIWIRKSITPQQIKTTI